MRAVLKEKFFRDLIFMLTILKDPHQGIGCLLKKYIKNPALLMAVVFYLAGCATVPPHQGEIPQTRKGIYHKVRHSETLWRIAKAYEVPLNDIIQINNIPNVAKVEDNQLIFIPGATAVKEIKLDPANNDKEFGWPVQGKMVGYFHERKGRLLNQGVDIQVPGGTEIKAARSGSVVFADNLTGYGETVILDHGDGFYSVYAENAKLLVRLGEEVKKNSPVAEAAGNNDLAYVHFQIRKKSSEENPLYYLP